MVYYTPNFLSQSILDFEIDMSLQGSGQNKFKSYQ